MFTMTVDLGLLFFVMPALMFIMGYLGRIASALEKRNEADKLN